MARATIHDYKRLVRSTKQFLRMLRCDCINGFGVAFKRVKGKETKHLSIAVYVSRKLPLRRLAMANRIPDRILIPDDRAPGGVIEFVTDVQEAVFNSLEYTAKMRPAPSGISIGHEDITAGTLGGLMRDREAGDVVILSNNHVLASSNEANIGDPILQPGPADGGTADDQIATLTRFVPIDFAEGAENQVDAAIATPLKPESVVWRTQDIGAEIPAETRNLADADLGLFVHKTGRTTEHTQGFVQALYATVQVKYDLFKTATFIDQIVVSQSPAEESFSDGGDSGSLIYDSDNKCVGLLFAGSQGSETEPATTIANPIRYVLKSLNVELLSPGGHPSGEEP